MRYAETGSRDDGGYQYYSCGIIHDDTLYGDSKDVERFAGKSALTIEERVALLFNQRFGR